MKYPLFKHAVSLFITIAFVFLRILLHGQPDPCSSDMRLVEAGEFTPLYGEVGILSIDSFFMDVYPVTNAEFLEFVRNDPQYRRSNMKRLYATENYLNEWISDTTLGPLAPDNSPVTHVSWFAAKAYCRACGKDLPTMDQWEWAASAGPTEPNAYLDPAFNEMILRAYNQPLGLPLPNVGSTFMDHWGLYDMHGLVWEWVSDLSVLQISDISSDPDVLADQLYCAAERIPKVDPANYPSYIRYSFRGSLEAKYCIWNLGFRCVKNNGAIRGAE